MVFARLIGHNTVTHVLQNRNLRSSCDFCEDEVIRRRIRSKRTGLFTHYFQHKHNPACIGVNQPRRLGCRTTIA